jgi:DNA-directed RNA polymerase specialized sigma subunit
MKEMKNYKGNLLIGLSYPGKREGRRPLAYPRGKSKLVINGDQLHANAEEQLGRVPRPQELADFLGVDEKRVRQYYVELGGIRLGRLYVFFEQEVINAIQASRRFGQRGGARNCDSIQAILRHKNSNTTQRYLHRLSELKTVLTALLQRKSRLPEPSPSTKRQTKLRVVNN